MFGAISRGLSMGRAFPADCPHLTDCHCRRRRGEYRRIHRVFQQIARFVLGTTAVQPIVTAAVYRGFGSKLRTLRHRAGVRPYTSSCELAESCVFSKQSLDPILCDPFRLNTLVGHPFSRSYGVILPSSFTRVLPSACGYSPRPPVSVYGTGALTTGLEDFLGSGVSARL